MKLELWTLYDYVVTVTDTASRREFMVSFRTAADGSPLRPAQPGPPAPAADNGSAPASHGGALAAAVASGPGGALPRTGAGIVLDAGMALSLLLAGAGALAIARCRSTDR